MMAKAMIEYENQTEFPDNTKQVRKLSNHIHFLRNRFEYVFFYTKPEVQTLELYAPSFTINLLFLKLVTN